MAFTFVSGNAFKLKELQEMMGVPVKSINIDLVEIQGEPEEVACAKCRAAQLHVDGPVLIEDSSLCFNALNGMPGVYTKWFVERMGLECLVKILETYRNKAAYAQCIYALSGDNGVVHLFKGVRHGNIVTPRGSTEFGWDSIFEPDGYIQTYAEMTSENKYGISDRSEAFKKLMAHLAQKKYTK